MVYIRKLDGESPYEAHAGVLTALNRVHYVKIKEKLPDGKLVITNPPEPGQKKVKQLEVVVKPDLIYQLIRGLDVKRWYVDYRDRDIILTHDPGTRQPLTRIELQQKYPGIWAPLPVQRGPQV
ncbi:MAG: hypothetical protein QW290_09105 [Sulfolobales archaeon]